MRDPRTDPQSGDVLRPRCSRTWTVVSRKSMLGGNSSIVKYEEGGSVAELWIGAWWQTCSDAAVVRLSEDRP